jgi:hypothetical protein
MEKDVYIKDEGDFYTAVFQSEKAKKVLNKQPKVVINETYGNEVPKLDVPLESKNSIITWCASHNLTVEEF